MTQTQLFDNQFLPYENVKSIVNEKWAPILNRELNQDYMESLIKRLRKERDQFKVFPEQGNVLKAFRMTDPENIKIVMVGQDPYPHESADGLAFSSKTGKLPPSLSRIYREIEKDLGYASWNPNLDHWAEQGILLLNTRLTVRANQPKSHKFLGWEQFTGFVLNKLSNKDNTVFMLFGKDAHEMRSSIVTKNNLIIKASHPARKQSYSIDLKDQGYFKQAMDFVGCQIDF